MLNKKLKNKILKYKTTIISLVKNLTLKAIIKNKYTKNSNKILKYKLKKTPLNFICIQTKRQRGKIKFTKFSRHATNKLSKQGLLQNFRIIN